MARRRRISGSGLAKATLDAEALRQMKGSDVRKVALARLLWEHTTVFQGWIAERLHMSSAANVSQLLSRPSSQRQEALPDNLSNWLNSVKK